MILVTIVCVVLFLVFFLATGKSVQQESLINFFNDSCVYQLCVELSLLLPATSKAEPEILIQC